MARLSISSSPMVAAARRRPPGNVVLPSMRYVFSSSRSCPSDFRLTPPLLLQKEYVNDKVKAIPILRFDVRLTMIFLFSFPTTTGTRSGSPIVRLTPCLTLVTSLSFFSTHEASAIVTFPQLNYNVLSWPLLLVCLRKSTRSCTLSMTWSLNEIRYRMSRSLSKYADHHPLYQSVLIQNNVTTTEKQKQIQYDNISRP